MEIEIAKGETLDKFGEWYWIARKRIKSIKLLFGWKLVKEESDEEFRKRILKRIKAEV